MHDIGILTYHTGFNYGASLQAYALSHILKKKGLSCEIINFETERFLHSREMISRKPVRMKEHIKNVFRAPYYRVLMKRENMFNRFRNEMLPVSALYRTEEEVVRHADEYRTIVCGSDQIWNLGAYGDEFAANMLFYLNFPKKERRVSYAASMGYWIKDAHCREAEFVPWLKEFDVISVRESGTEEYLKSLGIPCVTVLDPTLLLDVEEYKKISCASDVKEPFILLFSWNTPKSVVCAAKKLSRMTGVPVLNIVPPPRGMFSGIRRKLDVGPREFLGLMEKADYVITNSFHGTVFSNIFEKKYFYICDKYPDVRIASLLKQLNLQDHIFHSLDTDALHTVEKTDFGEVKKKIEKLRKASFEFIDNEIVREMK